MITDTDNFVALLLLLYYHVTEQERTKGMNSSTGLASSLPDSYSDFCSSVYLNRLCNGKESLALRFAQVTEAPTPAMENALHCRVT